jgi:diguanylate cyclase (GGDEF)-like protein
MAAKKGARLGFALVVDDSPVELLVGQALLEKLGYRVLTAGTGADALDMLKGHPVRLVICDMTMPGFSGLDLLDASRTLDDPPVFIMATGLDDAKNAVTALQRGASDYLVKPLREAAVKAAIDEALLRRGKERRAREQLHKVTTSDLLTGQLNKEEFSRQFGAQLAGGHARDLPGALVFVNIDGLRYINETHGHREGDLVIQHVARLLRKSVRPTDLVARFGGDIFAVNLAGITPDNVQAKSRALLQKIEQGEPGIAGRTRDVTVTLGVVLYPPFEDAERLISNAELALRQARDLGRNRFHVYSASDETSRRELSAHLDVIDCMKRALKDGSFEMHFQPIVHLGSGRTNHYEALIRMYDAGRKLVAPALFIAPAEQFGLIGGVDRWAVHNCIQTMARESLQDKTAHVSINISGKSIDDPVFLDDLRKLLTHNGTDPSRIVFEITETAVFRNLAQVQRFIEEIKRLGCQFALDDFGVGFSSFHYIKQLDVDFIKIDGSFIKHLAENPDDQAFVRAMVEISRVLDIKVVAEWVENEAILGMLKNLGVDYGQGYYFGKPEPLAI